jgi:hypothetical protein
MTLGIDQNPIMLALGPFAFYLASVANIASLLIGDRRKTWVKLNYLLLGVWLLFFAVGTFLLFFVIFA